MKSVSAEFLLARVSTIRMWKRGSQQAVNKPLLLLYAIGRLQHGSDRLLPFLDVDRDLKVLMERFGPSRSVYHPEYPFWRLQNDGVWEVVSDAPLRSRARNSDPRRSELLSKGARGGFRTELFTVLKAEKNLANQVCSRILTASFPGEAHANILVAVGIGHGG